MTQNPAMQPTKQTTSAADGSGAPNRTGLLSHELLTEITIDAPVDTVWSVLTDLASYGEWNPFVIEAGGDVQEGARLTLRIQPVGGKASRFESTVSEVVPGRVFEWVGHLVTSRLFQGRHRFELHPTADGSATRFRQTEYFTGLLVPLVARTLNKGTLAGFVAMNEALRRRAEQAQAQVDGVSPHDER